jgi:hypothetical protein
MSVAFKVRNNRNRDGCNTTDIDRHSCTALVRNMGLSVLVSIIGGFPLCILASCPSAAILCHGLSHESYQ